MPAATKMLVLLAVMATPAAFGGSLRDVDHFEKAESYRGKCHDYKCPDDWGMVSDYDRKECRDKTCHDDECCEKKDYDKCRDYKCPDDRKPVHDYDYKDCSDKCHDDECCDKKW